MRITLLAASLLLCTGAAAGEPSSKAVIAAPGLLIEKIPVSVPPPVNAGDGIITVVRIDPRRYEFRLLTAAAHGARTAPRWVADFDLTGVINASMFRSPDNRSTGYMVDGEDANNGYVNPAFGAFFAFAPRALQTTPVELFGRQCEGFDLSRIRDSYRTVIQNYRMLDCDSNAILWKDTKIYSIAAVGVDSDGWVVFIHSRTPYRMREFNRMIASPDLRIRAAMFVEGGPEASLYVKTDGVVVREMGSYESGWMESDSNILFWSIPNVIGFSPVGTENNAASPSISHEP